MFYSKNKRISFFFFIFEKVWFQNRRIKWRRQTLDDHQQRLTSLTANKQVPSTITDEHRNSDVNE